MNLRDRLAPEAVPTLIRELKVLYLEAFLAERLV